MFEVGWTELLVIAVVALVVIGPKDLPRAMRVVGQWTGKMKKMAREFQSQFNEALREAELEGVKKDVEAIGKIDPLAGVRKEMASVDTAVRRELDKPAIPATAVAAAPAPEAPAPLASEPLVPAAPAPVSTGKAEP